MRKDKKAPTEGLEKVDEGFLIKIIQNINVAILLHNCQSQVVFTNDMFEKLLEIKRQDMYGKTAFDFMPEFDGKTKSVIEGMLRNTLETGEKSSVYEFSYYCPSETLRKFNFSLVPILNNEGEVTYAMSLIEDISNIKKLQKEAVMAVRLSSIADMAYTLAHEINNPLTGITLGLSELHDSLEKKENIKILDSVLKELSRIQGLVYSFVKAKKTPFLLKKERLSILGDIMNDVAFHLSRQLSLKEIRFEQCDWDDELSVMVDRDRIYQMFLNTFLNSIKSISQKGVISVSKRIVTNIPGVEVVGPFLCISFVDNGSGIEPKQKEEISQVLKHPGSVGSGMGLSLCKDIISSHNGFMDLSSQLGKGTTVQFYLPISFIMR